MTRLTVWFSVCSVGWLTVSSWVSVCCRCRVFFFCSFIGRMYFSTKIYSHHLIVYFHSSPPCQSWPHKIYVVHIRHVRDFFFRHFFFLALISRFRLFLSLALIYEYIFARASMAERPNYMIFGRSIVHHIIYVFILSESRHIFPLFSQLHQAFSLCFSFSIQHTRAKE